VKKLIVLLLSVALAVALVPFQPLNLEARTIRILLDGAPMTVEVAPVIRAGRVLVPFRALFEAFGATVGWQEATETVTGQLGTTSIALRLNREEAVVNGRTVRLDVAPFVMAGRTLVPLRFVAENLGADVTWDESTYTVTVVRQAALRNVRIAGDAHSAKLAAYANPNAFISPAELKQLMDRNEPDVVVIGVINPTLAIIPLHAAGSPIAGSFTVWRGDYCGPNSPLALAPALGGMARSQEVMEGLLSRAGATPQSMIVVYALDALHDSARFMWQIRQLGHRDVRLLDGGLNAWRAANFPTGRFVRLVDQPVQTAYKAPNHNPAVNNVRLGDVITALQNPNEWVVIDTRSADEFNGRPSTSSRGAFGIGRLIGSVHIEWVAANAPDRTIRTREEIAAAYSAAIRGRKVIVFCQSGVRSAHTQIVLRDVLGIEAYNYDGSWIELSFAASEYSRNQVPESVRRTVLQHIEQWTDNRGVLR